MKTVYLSGPMTGCSDLEMEGWRQSVSGILADISIKTLSPTRHLEDLIYLGDRFAFYRDYNDVKNCDALLVNFLGAKQVSIGTIFEVCWAHMLKIPCVIVMNNGNQHSHLFVKEAASVIVPTMKEGLRHLVSVLNCDDDALDKLEDLWTMKERPH